MVSHTILIILLVCCFSWSASAFFNRGVTCDEFETENGNHFPRAPYYIRKFPVFTVIKFECDKGYDLRGNPTATCMLNGEWNQKPKCVESEGKEKARISCQLPPMGDDAEVKPSKAVFDLGESATFACAGVRKAGSRMTTRCGEDKLFHPKPPKCIEPKCVPPAISTRVAIRPNKPSYSIGDVVVFECAKEYEVVGDKNATCGTDGYFTYYETECKESKRSQLATCKRPIISDEQTINHDKNVYYEGEHIMFQCGSGYKLKGQRISKCKSDGKWSSPNPRCMQDALVYCVRPNNPEHGSVLYKKKYWYRVGQMAKFSCDRSYNMSGQSECKCGNNGDFFPPIPKCERYY